MGAARWFHFYYWIGVFLHYAREESFESAVEHITKAKVEMRENLKMLRKKSPEHLRAAKLRAAARAEAKARAEWE
jgi:hypothetical protein